MAPARQEGTGVEARGPARGASPARSRYSASSRRSRRGSPTSWWGRRGS